MTAVMMCPDAVFQLPAAANGTYKCIRDRPGKQYISRSKTQRSSGACSGGMHQKLPCHALTHGLELKQ